VIAIVDYGMGNLGSIRNMLMHLGVDSEITCDPERIAAARKLILPGVGACDRAMTNLEERGLIPVLNRDVLERGKPVLGICLGMQLLSRRSEEGTLPGLGWIEADTIRFRFGPDRTNLKIPHMGWNRVTVRRSGSGWTICRRSPASILSTPTMSAATGRRTSWPRRTTVLNSTPR
jgi:glutamine amidotransferase